MSKRILSFLFCCLCTSQAFAKLELQKIKCLADTDGAQRAEIPVLLTMGSAPEQKIDYKGNQIAVGFFAGNPYESQQVLAIELNGYTTKVYDPSQSLYMLHAPNLVKVQCYIEQ